MPRGAATTRIRPGRHRVDDVDRHVGARMRERRLVLGLNQRQLAERIGAVYQQVHKYEMGINRVSAGQLLAVARALGVEPGYFFEDLGAELPAEPTPRQRAVLELARNFLALPSRRQQEALCELARALADAATGPEGAADEAVYPCLRHD